MDQLRNGRAGAARKPPPPVIQAPERAFYLLGGTSNKKCSISNTGDLVIVLLLGGMGDLRFSQGPAKVVRSFIPRACTISLTRCSFFVEHMPWRDRQR